MKVLAGVEVAAKSVERAAEGIGAADIAEGEQALQSDLRVVAGEPTPCCA